MICILLISAVLAAGAPTVEVDSPTDGNCGKMGAGPMRRPVRDMTGGCVPSGVAPATLPAPNSPEAKLFARYCAQCHHLASPATHTAHEWPAVITRMIDRMESYRISRGRMGRTLIQMLTAEEQRAVLTYLQRHALTAARPDALGPSHDPGLSQFKQTCSQCHALPDPRLHTAADWPGVVERMRRNMKRMGRPEISDRERDAIVGYLEHRTAR